MKAGADKNIVVGKIKLRKDDQVAVISGKSKGKEGKILSVNREKNLAVIAGVNIVKKAQKKQKQTDRGGIMEIERPIHLSNVMIVCRKCGPTRIASKVIEGSKKRVCRKCEGVL